MGFLILTYDNCKILSPVGSMDVLKSAVFSGADFVYLSGRSYGARDYAKNFTYDEIKDAVKFCHKYNVGVFVTVNTCILDREIPDVLDYIYYLYVQGVDAIIVQDIGLMSLVRDLLPDLKIHASTQMTVYDYSFVKWLYENGVDSVNLSREVPLSRICEISAKLKKYDYDINLEAFVHGALCYCYSGQCLLSSFYGGRSGNRGLCAQPCRMRYTFKDYYNTLLRDSNYLLSTKDLCTYNNISDFIDAGVNCLKIEGRMKSSEYVSSTTFAYKNAVNGEPGEDDYLLLNLAFNRGFTEGYVSNKRPSEVVGRTNAGNIGYPIGRVIKNKDDEITIKFTNKRFPTKIVNGDGLKFELNGESCGMYVSKIISQSKNKISIQKKRGITIEKDSLVYITYSKYLKDRTKSIINKENIHKTIINLSIRINNESQLVIKASSDMLENMISYKSKEKFQKAINKPVTKETMNKQLRKTGNTTYEIKKINYENFKENLFMPISTINNIRRELIEKIDNEIMNSYIPPEEKRKEYEQNIQEFKEKHFLKKDNDNNEKWNLYINNIKQIEKLNDYSFITSIYYDANFNYKNMDEYIYNITKEIKKIKQTVPDKEIVWILPQIILDKDLPHISETILKLKFEGINLKIQTDNIAVAKNLDIDTYGNHLNIYNNYTINKLSEDPGFKKVVISNEISYDDIKELNNNNCELEYIVFGYLQVMITKDNFEDLIDEELTNTYYLIDKRNNKFLMKKDCNNNSHIYDYRIVNLSNYLEKLRKTNINNFTIDCRFFNNEDTKRILEHFKNVIENKRIEKLNLTAKNTFFNGNIEKGVFKNL